jgi:endonuclease/exonuclease/phosphatase family metal-dependent hydrolase
MTRRTFFVMALILGGVGLGVARPTQTTPAEAPPTIRLGAWNIEWCGNADRRKGPEQSPEHIGAYLLENKVDLLSVEEVSFTEGTEAEPRSKILSGATAWLKEKTGTTWKHMLFPKLPGVGEPGFEKHQWTGVVWNTAKVQLVGEPFKIPVRRSGANKEIWVRWPHAVKFSTGAGKTDLVIIPIHMKSNRGGAGPTAEQRTEEAKALVRALGEVANKFNDDDIVLLGDFNFRNSSEKGHARLVAAGLRDLNKDDTPTWIADASYPAAPFDRIFVPEDQPEFRNCVLTVAKSASFLKNTRYPGTIEEKFRHYLSDHWMVFTDVPILDDDD